MTGSRPSAALPHTGIATFCKAPYVFDPQKIQADIVVLGVPFDGMASMHPGCRQAPRALRDASARFGWLGEPAGSKGFFEISTGKTFLAGKKMFDAGDVDVSLDAHLDYRDRFLDMPFSNNSPFRRANELSFVKRIITIGARGIKSTDIEYRESLRRGNLVFSAEDIAGRTADSIADEVGHLGNYYLSLDIDGLDPSIAPGTESPEADGLTFRQVKTILRRLGVQGKMVGVDLVEVNPYLDHAELTQHIAVQLLIEALASGLG